MTVPIWARYMVGNYREAFREKHGRPYGGTDQVIWDICATVHDDTSQTEEEQARLGAMLQREGE